MPQRWSHLQHFATSFAHASPIVSALFSRSALQLATTVVICVIVGLGRIRTSACTALHCCFALAANANVASTVRHMARVTGGAVGVHVIHTHARMLHNHNTIGNNASPLAAWGGETAQASPSPSPMNGHGGVWAGDAPSATPHASNAHTHGRCPAVGSPHPRTVWRCRSPAAAAAVGDAARGGVNGRAAPH